jgi:hypothetical protein
MFLCRQNERRMKMKIFGGTEEVKPEAAKPVEIKPEEVKPSEVKEKESITQFKVKSDSGEVLVEIEEFVKFGSIRKEIKIGNMDILMKTLPNKERLKATSLVNVDINKSINEYIEKLRIPILSYSIIKLNGIPFISDEDRDKLRTILDESQDVVIDRLWEEYNKMLNEQNELFENDELKKKS